MALSADTYLTRCVGGNAIPAASDAVVYKGSMISISADSGDVGYGHALVASEVFAGHAKVGVDNTDGADGAENIEVDAGRYSLKVTLTGVAASNLNATVYASDDATLTLTAGSNSTVGKVVRYISANTCEVEFRPFP